MKKTNFKAKMKTFERACLSSDLVETGHRPGTEAWKLWHPLGKNLTVTAEDMHFFGEDVTVSVRDTRTGRDGGIKVIYNVFHNGKSMTAYDIWFEWILNGEPFKLDEELFEI